METRSGVAMIAGFVFIGLLVAGLVVLPTDWPAPRPTLTAIPGGTIPDGPETGVYPGEIAPDFALPDLTMQEIRLSDHRGHKVLLNFFTSWCEPCRLEMPGVQSQYEKHTEHGWMVIGVDIMEPPADVSAFRDEFGLTFPIMLDGAGRVSQMYEIRGTPTNITIDQNGRIVDRQLGYMSESEVETMLLTVP